MRASPSFILISRLYLAETRRRSFVLSLAARLPHPVIPPSHMPELYLRRSF